MLSSEGERVLNENDRSHPFWRWAGLAALLLGSTAVSAKTLVFCSEGSPENFTPAMNTTGTSLDAARPAFDQLIEFERGSTKLKPGLAESWEMSRGRQDHHLPSAQGREIPRDQGMEADARLQRR